MRALEKDPARRFQSAEEFIAALEARPPRADAADRDGADAGRAVGRGAALALVGVGAGLLVVAAIAVGAYFLLAGNKVDVPNVVGRRPSEAADIAAQARAGGRLRQRESDDVPRDEVISQDPRPGDRVQGGHDRHGRSSPPAGATAPVPARRRPVRGATP